MVKFSKLKVKFLGFICLIACFFAFSSVISCEIGLGSAVDIAVPTSGISYPPQNAVVRDTFVAAGSCEDDQEVKEVRVSVIDTENNKAYGPYQASLSQDKKAWSVTLNNKDPEKTSSRFDSYKQWELPDGNYVISAIAYDTADKESAVATSPISIDNTAPVLIVSKPLAKGTSMAPTIYGSTLKISGDIAEDHETSKMIITLREFDDSTGAYVAGSSVQTIEITNAAELNAMSSSNPLIIAKFDRSNANSDQHKNYVKLFGNNESAPDKFYYCGFLLEDNAKVYNNPGDSGSDTGNQTDCYYLLTEQDFQKNLAVNYSLTAQRLMKIFKGSSEDYNESQINGIASILTKTENYSSSSNISEESSKFSLNPHNNPTWNLEENYIVRNGTFGSYQAGSSLILSLTAGRDASYPDPKTVTVDMYDITVKDENGNYQTNVLPTDFSTTGKDKIVLIGQGGKVAGKWDESADDANKTKTFTLDTVECGLIANHYYKFDVKGTDRNKTDLEPLNGNEYVLRLSTGNNIPRVYIREPLSDATFGTAADYGNVNTDGVTVKGYIITDGVALNESSPIAVKISRSDSTVEVTSAYDAPPVISPDTVVANQYNFEIPVKANADNTFVPATESKYLYTVTVTAKDASDLEGEKQVKFYVDNKKPEVKINPVSPVVKDGSNEYVNGTITVSGVASDSGNTGSGLKSVIYKIDGGAPVTIASATAGQSIPESWSFTLSTRNLTDSASGVTHTIEVTAVDTVGNIKSASKSFVLKQSTDTPVLNLSNADVSITTAAALKHTTSTETKIYNMFGVTSNNKLYGSISDDDGLENVEIKYQKDGAGTETTINPVTPLTPDAKSHSLEYVLPSTMAEGQYKITVTAKDNKHETNKDTLSKSFWIIVDEGAPVLSNISVAPAAVNDWYKGNQSGSNSEKIKVTGKVKDGSGLVTLERKLVKIGTSETEVAGYSKTVDLKVNETTATPAHIAKGVNWTDEITLPSASGKYKVIYSATDKYEQEESYLIEFSVDVDAPTFSVLNIGSNEINNPSTASSFTSWISDNTVTVEATVGDGTGSGIKEVSYTLGGSTYKPMLQSTSNQSTSNETKWSADVSFDEGSEKTIKLRVTDNVENKKETATFKVNIDKTKPTLDVKWYKISDNSTDGTLVEIPQTGIAPTAYVNAKDLVIFGNYDDGTTGSGVKALSFKVGGESYTPSTGNLTYFNKAFTTETAMDGAGGVLEKDTDGKYKNAVTYSEANVKNIKSFIAVIDHSAWASATGDVSVTVSGSDQVGEIHGVTKTAVTLKKDTGKPLVSGVVINQIKDSDTKAAYGPVSGKYYIRNKIDGNLKLEGTTTDSDGLVDYTIVEITGKDADGNEKKYTAKTSDGSWTITKDDANKALDLSTWAKNSSTGPDATITITAYDKAGNSSASNTNANCVKTLDLYFDEAGPEVLTGKVNGTDKPKGYKDQNVSDENDTSNPYSSDYTFRGKTAWKYGGIKIGNGKYGDTSYGRESSLKISVTFIGEAKGSGVQKMEYRLLKASDASAYSSTHTGLYSGEIPATATAAKEFTSVVADKYKHYGSNTEYDCYVGTETINGFEPTTDGNPNLLFVRAIDNCGNAGRWFVLLVQMDNEKPTVTSDSTNPDSLLTNGKSTLPTLKGSFDDGAKGSGLKAARVKLDGNTIINAAFTQKTDELADYTITAKDTTGHDIDVSNQTVNTIYNDAVEVSFTNDYGTFTYKTKEEEPDAEGHRKRYSFKDASSKAEWELTLTPQTGTWFNAIKAKTLNPQITVEAEDWAEDATGSGNKGTNIVSSLDIDTQAPSVNLSSPLNTKTLNGKQDIAGTVTENHTPKTVEIWYSNAATPTAFGTDEKTAFKLLKKVTVGDTLADGTKVEEKDIYNFKYTHNFNELLKSDNSGNKIAGEVHLLVYTEDKAGNYNISKSATLTSTNYKTYNVDPDSDRPIITVTNRKIAPMSSLAYLLIDTDTLNIKLEDDDGIQKAEYYITKTDAGTGDAAANYNKWVDFTSKISQNTASITFGKDGKQELKFRITDSQGGVFSNDIYLKDSESTPNYAGDAVIYADVDTNPPEIKKPVYAQLVQTAPASVTAIDQNKWETDYTKLHAGGPSAKYLILKLQAEDTGSGIANNGVKLSATLNVNGTAKTITQEESTWEDGGYYYRIIPAFVFKANSTTVEEEVEKADYIVKIEVADKAGRKATNSITLKADNKKPEIKITSPSKTENLSGIINIDGSVTNENAVIEWAISPLEASPAGYSSSTEWKYKNAETGAEVTLPANDKAGTQINPSKNLWELCKYTKLSDTSMMAFNFQLDGGDGTGHLPTLEDWIKNIGITKHDDLHTANNPFNTIVQLYFHVRATDESGNVNEEHYPIRVDPLGSRPTVSIGYPTKEKAGENTDGLVLGGKPTIIGTATGLNTVQYIWLQIDTNSTVGSDEWNWQNGEWDWQDVNTLRSKGYWIGKMSDNSQLTSVLTASDNAKEYAIRVNDTPLSGMSWKQQINLEGELDPAAGESQRPVTIWAYATDDKNLVSSPEIRRMWIDQGTPIIEQDIKLVQWNEAYTGSTYFTFNNGKIEFDTGAVKAVRSYNGKESVKGRWFIIGKVKDESGLKSVKFKINDASTEYGVTSSGDSYTGSTTDATTKGAFISCVSETNSQNKDVNNYLFCIPIGNDTENEVGNYTIHFEATEKEESNPKSVSRDFEVLYDNKAPEAPVLLKLSGREIAAGTTVDIYNSNKKFTFGGKATEEKVGGISQTGVERIAFYFTRDIKGQEKRLYDVMIHDSTEDLGNHRSYASGLTKKDNLYWQSASVKITDTDLTITDTDYNFKNIHVGGLAKVNGVIYKIQGVNTTTKKVSLSGAPGDTATDATTSALFAIANVVDNPTRESEGTTAVTTSGYGYGYGYYNDGGKDGDLMVESLISTDNINYNWEANINTKNMSDGPVTLHYVVFDKAGNASGEQTVECFVKNNAPRLAGVTLGTDTNGNGSVETDEYVTEYGKLYAGGYSNNGKTKMTSLTVPTSSTKENPVSVFKIKGKTIIEPVIVGGNGKLSYKYKVWKYNSTEKDWKSIFGTDYFTPVAARKWADSVVGSGENDNTEIKPQIVLEVADFLNNGIEDGNNHKFEFQISDETPGLNDASGNATVSAQLASLNIIMSMDMNDNVKPVNKIIPFYWKSASVNSLKDNSKANGHIELSRDWSVTSGDTNAVTGDKDPKVSGAFKLEGIAQDNILLTKLYVNFDKVKLDGTNENTLIAENTFNETTKKWAWTPKHTDAAKWEASVRQATYEEFIAAGCPGAVTALTEATLPEGKKLSDYVPEISQEYGHVVHWTLTLDTQALRLTPKANMVINASAKDRGSPSLNNDVLGYTPKTSDTSTAQSGGDDGTATLTSHYQIDLVPYITKVKTWLSDKSKKDDTSEYDRTARGHYPVKAGETITLSGFNLGGDKTYTVAANASSGPISLSVSGIDTLNNKNNNDAKGTSTELVADFTDEEKAPDSLKHFYNRTPNDTNNYTLTDDVVLDVWGFNSNAAQPNGGGRIDEVSMKINPNTKIIGFSFLDSYRYFALPKGKTNSYNGTNDSPSAQFDFRSTGTLAYDWRGWSYATDAGGNEGDRIKLWIVDDNGTEQTSVAFEYTNQNKNRDNSGSSVDLRYKVRSPSIATSKGDTANTTNIYMAYYDSFNDEIRYRAGNSDKNNRMLLVNGSSNAAYSCQNAQVIATDATKNLPTSDNRYGYIGTPLGGAGEFVSLDVIPKGTKNTAGTVIQSTSDIVVIVWYDAQAKSLKYAYNKDPLNYDWRSDNTNHTAYRGLNRENWKGEKTIFAGAGEYCQVKVDQYGGIHIAAFDPTYGDLRYAYLESYSSNYNEDSMSYVVDSSGNTGSHLVMDVAYDKAPTNDATTTGKPVPYITYWGSGMPKIAHPVNGCASAGANNELFTGNWEVSYIPTTSTIADLDQKKLNNLDNRINVALWKYDADGLVTTIQSSTKVTGSASGTSGTCYGNGTANPVVGYSIMANLTGGGSDSANDRIETAQMQ